MCMTSKISVAALPLICAAVAQAAGPAHVHGAAKLDIAIEPTRISVQMEMPLENLLGFERAPRTDAERRQADSVVTRLRAATAMFAIDPAAQCKPAQVELSSAPLKLGKSEPEAADAGHADVDGTFAFDCRDASKAAYIDVGLFEFARLQKLEVQIVAPRGQFKRDLKRPNHRIVLSP
jgi:hypothetical protein